MNTPEERQRARDRAADAIAPHDHVILGPNGWAAPVVHGPNISSGERRRRDLDRKREKQRIRDRARRARHA